MVATGKAERRTFITTARLLEGASLVWESFMELSVSQAERDRGSRGSDVQHGDRTLQLVVSGLVEHIADSDHANVFADEVYRQARCAAAEHPRHGIQFLTAILQVGSGYEEVCSAEGGAGGE